jgi:group I intron endonuclease
MNGQIYLLIDKRNGKKYIGKHNGNKKNYFTGGIIPNKIIKKFGEDIFERIIIHKDIETEKELNELEEFYIEKYKTFEDGYNLTKGGDGGGNWVHKKTKEELERISKKKSEKLRGREFSDETREKMSKAKKGVPLAKEHAEKIKKSQSGENHPWCGRKHKEETKNKIRNSKKGKKNPEFSKWMKDNAWNMVKVSIDDIEYRSMAKAGEALNISKATVKSRCNSKHWPKWFRITKN